nr:hypothetical protein [Streptomyces sp. NRRL S-337]
MLRRRWPNAPHRALRNSTLRAWEAADRPAAPNRPGEGAVVARSADGRAWSCYDDMVPVLGMSGDVEALGLYAGQRAGLVHDVARRAASWRASPRPPRPP